MTAVRLSVARVGVRHLISNYLTETDSGTPLKKSEIATCLNVVSPTRALSFVDQFRLLRHTGFSRNSMCMNLMNMRWEYDESNFKERTLSKFVGTISPLHWIQNEHELRSANSAVKLWLVSKQLMLTYNIYIYIIYYRWTQNELKMRYKIII